MTPNRDPMTEQTLVNAQTAGEIVTGLEQEIGKVIVGQHTLIRLAMANVKWASHEVSEFVYKASGTLGLRSGTIQRLFRDMHAGTQHIVAAPPVFRAAGRELAGLGEGKTWLFLDLVDPSGS